MKEADQAIQLPREERLGLVVELLPSEDEEEDQMDFDGNLIIVSYLIVDCAYHILC